MKSTACTYGNLALKVEPAAAPALRVIPGSKPMLQTGALQVAAPDTYALSQVAESARPRKGVLCLVAVCLFLMALGASAFHGAARSASHQLALDQLSTRTVTVEPGDSLWSIAAEHDVEGMSIDDEVELMRTMNSLTSATLHAGMEIEVPVTAQAA